MHAVHDSGAPTVCAALLGRSGGLYEGRRGPRPAAQLRAGVHRSGPGAVIFPVIPKKPGLLGLPSVLPSPGAEDKKVFPPLQEALSTERDFSLSLSPPSLRRKPPSK